MKNKLSKKRKLDFLKTMITIRQFENKIESNFVQGKIYGTAHTSVGQEAIAAGCGGALDKNDLMMTTHRGHGHIIAKGGNIKAMMAEIFGKKTGYCKGVGGSMHISDISIGNLGANGIVGAGIPIATGAAMAIKKLKTNQIVLCFFGEGATNQGVFHETLNMASLWELPIIYVCENNQYGMGLNVKKAMKSKNVSERANAYKIENFIIDGNDVLCIYENMVKLVGKVREKPAPILLECLTYRIKGHSIRDAQKYRSKKEVNLWLEKCPIKKYKNYLIENNIISKKEIIEVEDKIDRDLEEAVNFAEVSPILEFDELEKFIYG